MAENPAGIFSACRGHWHSFCRMLLPAPSHLSAYPYPRNVVEGGGADSTQGHPSQHPTFQIPQTALFITTKCGPSQPHRHQQLSDHILDLQSRSQEEISDSERPLEIPGECTPQSEGGCHTPPSSVVSLPQNRLEWLAKPLDIFSDSQTSV